MSVEVEAGREAFERRAWHEAYVELSAAERHAELELDDLQRLAVAAHLMGSDDTSDRWAIVYRACLRVGDLPRAARGAFWLAYGLLIAGEMARGGGWLARAHELVEETDHDCVERGYLLVPQAIALCDEDPAASLSAFVAAGEIAMQFGDPDLATIAQMGQGQALVASGACADALPVLDDAMVTVTAGEISPIVAGMVLCGAIDACQAILDLGRATEWTAALSRWCDAQPDLVPFRGQCLIHRAEIMQLHGEWNAAVEEAGRAIESRGLAAARGEALYRRAELHRLRGELDAAEADYRAALQAGREPQPGLALLRVEQGRLDEAAATIRRVKDEATTPAARARVLGPYVEIMAVVDDVEAAKRAAEELDEIAELIDTRYVRALAAHATGIVMVVSGDAQPALGLLRQAWGAWRDLDTPYEAAKARVLIGLACRALGDSDTAAMELDAAKLEFESLGAAHDAARTVALFDSPLSGNRAGLTDREVEVLVLVAQGETNRAIAVALVISEHTVARHIQNIFAKLGVTSRTAAASYAYENNLL